MHSMFNRVVLSMTATFAISAATPAGTFEYVIDDGDGESNFGPIFDANMLWGNYFYAEDPYSLITGIDVSFGSMENGSPIELLVFNDPDNDGDPGNAELVGSMESELEDPGPDEFMHYELPTAMEVSGGFFVAVRTNVIGREDHPASLDWDQDGEQSWVFFDDEGDMDGLIDDANLAGAALFYHMPKFAFPGAWLLRAQATTVPTPAGGALLMLAGLVGVGRRRRR